VKTSRKSTVGKAAASVAFGQRLDRALAYHPIVFKTKHATLVVQTKNGDLTALVKLAEKMCVDPRWLAIGEESPAAAMAMQRGRMWLGSRDLSEKSFRELLETLALAPHASTSPGLCRYCACTDEHGCGDCTWVDSAHTICSACLVEG
jgi:hypothetical protein